MARLDDNDGPEPGPVQTFLAITFMIALVVMFVGVAVGKVVEWLR